MRRTLQNAVFGLILALCCVFTICTSCFKGAVVKAVEEETKQERVELYCFGYKDDVNIIVLRLYDNEEYHLLVYDIKTKVSEKEEGTYRIVNGYVCLKSYDGKETITTIDKEKGTMTKPDIGTAPDQNCKHVEIVIDEKEPTCKEEGNTWGVKCKLCGGILHKPEVLPKLEHMYGEWVLRREATPTLKGLRERTCTICQTKDLNEFDYVASNYKVIGEYTMNLKTKELATLKLYNNNSCEITINKLDSSIFKITLNYQVVDSYIILFTDDRTQEYIIQVDEENKTFTPQLTEEQKSDPIGFIERNLETIIASCAGGGLTIGGLFFFILKIKKKVDSTIGVIKKNKEESDKSKEEINNSKDEFKNSTNETIKEINKTNDNMIKLTEKIESQIENTNKMSENLLSKYSDKMESMTEALLLMVNNNDNLVKKGIAEKINTILNSGVDKNEKETL